MNDISQVRQQSSVELPDARSILVVEERPVARDYIGTVLRQAGYVVYETSDADEALALVRVEHPSLVITDVLMQPMSGAAFADHLHDDPELARTQLMFYTASYRMAEARVIAKSCGVPFLLAKPAHPQEILDAVDAILCVAPRDTEQWTEPLSPLSLLGGRLPGYLNDLSGLQRRLRRTLDQAVEDAESRRAAATDSDATAYAFHALSLRLATLLELDIALASERDPQALVESFCQSAQDILNSRYAGISIAARGGAGRQIVATRGLSPEVATLFVSEGGPSGALQSVEPGKACRSGKAAPTSRLGLPLSHPLITSLLAVPMPHRTLDTPAGWIYFADKIGGAQFDDVDEQFAVTLAAQLSVMYGNLLLYDEARAAQADLAHRLTHDQTTGLPRFALVESHLSEALAGATLPDAQIVLLYIDLDRFHVVNETRGHAVGDDVLRMVAARLKLACEQNCYVAHVAGDEFAIVLVLPHDALNVIGRADAFRRAVESPIIIEGQRVYLTCSIGVSLFPQNGSCPQVLLRQAEAAVRYAKLDGRNTVRAFSNEHQQSLQDRTLLGGRLSDAIAANELVVHYQPQVDAKSGRITGFESLVRWQSPEFGFLMPSRFLEVAEDLGLIVDIGAIVLSCVCKQVRDWLDEGLNDFSVAVNVSGLELQRPEFVDMVRAAIARYDIPSGCIELELTESMVIGNVDRVVDTMHALKALGVQLAMDDFGTGYSSLSHLRRFPIDRLKIDRSFVRDICKDRGSAGVCRAIIALGHELRMTVLAEGVETSAQANHLLDNGCDQFQGFLFAKAAPAAVATNLLRERADPVAPQMVC